MHFLKTKLSSYLFYHALSTNSMQQSPSAKANSLSARQETSHIVWNLQVCYHMHNSLLLVPVMSQNNPVQALPSYSLKTHCNTIYPSMCRSSKWSFSPIHATCPTHHILLDSITQRIFGEEYWSWNSSICSLLQFPVTSLPLSPNILLKHPQPRFLPQCERPSFTSIQKNR